MPGQNEVALLRDQITEEVNRDAEVIGNQLFGQSANAREPDISRMSEDQLRAYYRQKFQSGDREWLQSEAQRDPQQFMRVAQAIGVVNAKDLPQPAPPAPPPNPLAPAAPQLALGAPAPPPVPSLAQPLASPAPAPVPPIQPGPSLPATGQPDPALVQALLAQQAGAMPPTGP